MSRNFNDLFDQIDATNNETSGLIEQLTATDLDQIISSLDSPLDKAQLYTSLAFVLNTLFYNYIKMQGINPKEHPVNQELERIKKHMLEFKQTPKIDKAAAARFVSSALSTESPIKLETPSKRKEEEPLKGESSKKKKKKNKN